MLENAADLPVDEFRATIRRWLFDHCPEAIRRPIDRLQGDEAENWHRIRFDGGVIAPSWPRDHGGMGLSVEQNIILLEEFDRHGVARTFEIGIAMLGPTLLRYGTDAQKRHYLPRILSGEDQWCQGYSEPGAGSDLASLRTAAVRDGDHYVVNGQKIWTSNANHSTHCFVLVRTDDSGRKQEGISFLLVDLNTPGVTVRPIRNLAGAEELCEVFYDDVRVPVESLVGNEGQGWEIAKSLLGFERLAIGSPAPAQLAIRLYRETARAVGKADDPLVHDILARLEMRLHALTSLFGEAVAAMASDRVIESDLPVLKIEAAELFQTAAEKALDLAGELGARGTIVTDGGMRNLAQLYMISRPTTIFGGTNEVQRNILAKRWLGLPAT